MILNWKSLNLSCRRPRRSDWLGCRVKFVQMSCLYKIGLFTFSVAKQPNLVRSSLYALFIPVSRDLRSGQIRSQIGPRLRLHSNTEFNPSVCTAVKAWGERGMHCYLRGMGQLIQIFQSSWPFWFDWINHFFRQSFDLYFILCSTGGPRYMRSFYLRICLYVIENHLFL